MPKPRRSRTTWPTCARHCLVLHAPLDQIIGIEHVTAIFSAAKHSKSFVYLASADHLLTDKRDAAYAAEILQHGRRDT